MSAETLVDSLRRSGWQGQIVGPHGSGKSTLVRTLVPALSAAGRSVVLFVLHQNERPHTSPPSDYRSWDSTTQVIVDGYEQLGWWRRGLIRWRCRGKRAGLLVTSHRETGLPDLWRTQTTVALADRLVAQLLRDGDASWLTDRAVERAFAASQGNMRETLLALYDVFEARTRLM
jgi:energy-coupling factor transporter ATP-binding protein EcfA2